MGEEYNLKEHEDSLKSFIHLYRVYFDSLLKLVRFDTWGDDGLEVEIQDFNTGISYNINKEKSCTRGPITNSPAEKYGLGFLGSLKNSTEFLSLDRNYYHIGYDFIRGIRCDVWESVARNVTIGDKTYVKYVLTYYFMTQWWQSVVNGIPQYQKPVRYQITGYEKDNAEPTFKEQYNMFAFRDSGVDLKLFEKFNIEDCEFGDDMEYFQVIFELDRNKVAIAEMNDQLFRTYLVILLAADMRVSPIRLPFLRADYSETSILVSVLLLEKPPSLTGFSLFDVDSFRIPRKTEKDAGRVENIDECATKCLQEKSPLCKSIHYCDHQCFLNSKDLTEEWGDPIGNYKNCDFYIRAVSDAVVFQSTNEEALKNLETSVNKSFIVRITPPTSDDSVDYKVTSVITNSGYYRFKDETYITVAEDYQLDGYSQTTRDLGTWELGPTASRDVEKRPLSSVAAFPTVPRTKTELVESPLS
ncbi:uncharacterized protein LOC143241838 [Tachypleus tridentatus]|uniref:uncharacterized protein LOC143241838 n=1 Tax=Tachypleus tridentatus TaxID=6853 RepID=UPI003FD2920D